MADLTLSGEVILDPEISAGGQRKLEKQIQSLGTPGGIGAAIKGALPGGVALGVTGGAAAIGIFTFALKKAHTEIMKVARDTAEFSGRMAAGLVLFDVQTALFKRRIGDEIAPEVGEMLQSMNRFRVATEKTRTNLLELGAGLLTKVIDAGTGATSFLQAADDKIQDLFIGGTRQFGRATGNDDLVRSMDALTESVNKERESRDKELRDRIAGKGLESQLAGVQGFLESIREQREADVEEERKRRAAGVNGLPTNAREAAERGIRKGRGR